jgi:hypothetical protein
MNCPNGFLIGEDYDTENECNCSNCTKETYSYCRNKNKSCIGKADFGSQIIAERNAHTQSDFTHHYMAYKCIYCSGWHIGRVFN